jgi:hypothetical protein
MQMRLTACNPGANFEPFSPVDSPQSGETEPPVRQGATAGASALT